jgi:hypothetical protein
LLIICLNSSVLGSQTWELLVSVVLGPAVYSPVHIYLNNHQSSLLPTALPAASVFI